MRSSICKVKHFNSIQLFSVDTDINIRICKPISIQTKVMCSLWILKSIKLNCHYNFHVHFMVPSSHVLLQILILFAPCSLLSTNLINSIKEGWMVHCANAIIHYPLSPATITSFIASQENE
jgi:hypothetical protein